MGANVAAKFTSSCISDTTAFLWFVMQNSTLHNTQSAAVLWVKTLWLESWVEGLTVVFRMKGGEQRT